MNLIRKLIGSVIATVGIAGFLASIIIGPLYFLALGIWEIVDMTQHGTATFGSVFWAVFLFGFREVICAIAAIVSIGVAHIGSNIVLND